MAKDKPLPFDAPEGDPEWFAYDDREEISWRPEIGDKINGKVIDIDLRTVVWKDQERLVPVLVLDTGEKQNVYTVWAMNTVLANELRKLAPQIGDRLGVVRQSDSENGYKRYRVVSPDARDRRFNWSHVSPRGDGVQLDPRTQRPTAKQFYADDEMPV